MVNTSLSTTGYVCEPGEHDGAAVDVVHATHAFLTRGEALHVLDDVSVSARPGEFVSLLGPSGCGKSTLLRLIAGLDTPLSGHLYADGKPIAGPDPSRGIIFQDPTLLPWTTVEQNIALGPRARGKRADPRAQARVDALIRMVDLDDFRAVLPSQLSGGMEQRVAFARALVGRPRILLLDEPLGKLDALTRSSLQKELERLWLDGRFTAIMVTHDVDEALLLSDRVVVFSPRPARVLEEVHIDLPRPRTQDDAHFRQLRHHILDLLGPRHGA